MVCITGTKRIHRAQLASLVRNFACILVIAAVCALFTCLAPNPAFAEVKKADVICGISVEQRGSSVAECPSIDATYAVLMGQDGTVYFERDAQAPSQIASITKVMTAIVALDNAREGTQITVSESAAAIGESSANLQAGDVMDLDAALKALLVPSGNDAAQALAETIGTQMIEDDSTRGIDPVVVFVQAMNDKAAEIGCVDTTYTNPHGLDDGEWAGSLHSTALDQAKVAQCAMGYEQIRTIVAGGSTTIKVQRDGKATDVDLETTDELLEMYEYTIGVKTGVTDLAGPSFMGAANKDGLELYSIVLGSTDEYQRFADTKTLFTWAYDHVHDLALAQTDEVATMTFDGTEREVPVIGEASLAEWTDKTVKATLAQPDATISVFDLEGNVSQAVTFDDLYGTVHEGDKVGSIVYKQRNMVVAEQDLLACETVEAPNPIETIQIAWTRFTSGLTGAQTQADSIVYNVMPIINNNVSNAA